MGIPYVPWFFKTLQSYCVFQAVNGVSLSHLRTAQTAFSHQQYDFRGLGLHHRNLPAVLLHPEGANCLFSQVGKEILITGSHLSKQTSGFTPLKIHMEHNSLEVWFRSFSFLMGDGCSFQPLIFQGVSKSEMVLTYPFFWGCQRYSWRILGWASKSSNCVVEARFKIIP